MSEVKVINSVYDAVNDVTVSIAAGTIERIVIKRINEDGSPRVTTFKDKNTGQQKSINNTHRYSILLKEGEDQAWVSFGEGEVKNLKYENQFQIKNPEGGYIDLKEGMKIRLPVSKKVFTRANGEQGESIEGKKSKIKVTDASGAREPRQQSTQQGQQQQKSSATTTKIYGDITSVDGNRVVVKVESGEEVFVVLSNDQLAQIAKDGRIAGLRDGEGKVTNFKAYGPKNSGGSAGNKSGGSKKDDLPIRLGNALSISEAMFPEQSVLEKGVIVEQILQAMDSVKAKLRDEFKSLDDYAFGARLGQSGILSARWGNESIDAFIQKTEETFRFINSLEDKIRNGGKVEEPVKQQDLKPSEEDAPQSTISDGHIDMSVADGMMDFDEEIPF